MANASPEHRFYPRDTSFWLACRNCDFIFARIRDTAVSTLPNIHFGDVPPPAKLQEQYIEFVMIFWITWIKFRWSSSRKRRIFLAEFTVFLVNVLFLNLNLDECHFPKRQVENLAAHGYMENQAGVVRRYEVVQSHPCAIGSMRNEAWRKVSPINEAIELSSRRSIHASVYGYASSKRLLSSLLRLCYLLSASHAPTYLGRNTASDDLCGKT